jgi:hypothetical protein
VFLALVFPDGYKKTAVHSYKVGNASYSHVLAIADCENSITYYSGYGWSKSGIFSDISVFEKYVAEFAESLKTPLKVTYGNKKTSPNITMGSFLNIQTVWREMYYLQRHVRKRSPQGET